MPSIYTPDATNATQPADTDYARLIAAEMRTLKSYIQSTVVSQVNALAVTYRNKVINGNFAVNQRQYASGAAVGANLYAHDRWKMAASADTYTYAIVNNKVTVTIPATKTLSQVIEGLNLQSGTYVLSWEGTAQGKIGAGSYGESGITATITGGTNTTITFNAGTVTNVQFELGSIPTAFQQRDLGLELLLCQRYYEPIIGLAGAAVIVGSYPVAGSEYLFYNFKVPKRAAPTFALTSGNSWSGAVPSGSFISNSAASFYHVNTPFYLTGSANLVTAAFSAEL